MEKVTLKQLDKLVQRKVRTDMKNNNATTHVKDVFIKYHTLLLRNVLMWLIKYNHKFAVDHVISVIKPHPLHNQLTADLSFAKYDFVMNFMAF